MLLGRLAADQGPDHAVLPRGEVVSRLRDRGEPISLFGESESDAFKRLRRCEILEPELNKVFILFVLVVICFDVSGLRVPEVNLILIKIM